VSVASRKPERARVLAEELGCGHVPWEEIPALAYDVLVNATPVGSAAAPHEMPVPAEWVRPSCLVLDAVYRPIRTALLGCVHERGGTPVPGAEWFVRQAALQFRLFTHQEPDEALLRHALEGALAAEQR